LVFSWARMLGKTLVSLTEAEMVSLWAFQMDVEMDNTLVRSSEYRLVHLLEQNLVIELKPKESFVNYYSNSPPIH